MHGLYWYCNDCGEPNKEEWDECHNCLGTSQYRPLYAEKKCAHDDCGYWRGQHIGVDFSIDSGIRCPEGDTTFEPEDY